MDGNDILRLGYPSGKVIGLALRAAEAAQAEGASEGDVLSDLAAVLDAILEMPAQTRIEFGQQARAHIVRSFSLPVMQTRLLNVYAELLG